jgi:hypothetical protein
LGPTSPEILIRNKMLRCGPALLVFSLSLQPVRSCECLASFSTCNEVKLSDLVFIGTVESIRLFFCVPRMVNTFTPWRELIMESLLTQIADELLVQDITKPSAVLGPLSNDELEAAYDFVLEHFAVELLIGADKTPIGPMANSSSTPTTAPSISSKQPSTLSGSKCGDVALRIASTDMFLAEQRIRGVLFCGRKWESSSLKSLNAISVSLAERENTLPSKYPTFPSALNQIELPPDERHSLKS